MTIVSTDIPYGLSLRDMQRKSIAIAPPNPPSHVRNISRPDARGGLSISSSGMLSRSLS